MNNKNLAIKAANRQTQLLKKKNGKYLIKKYFKSDCHYLTKALGEKLNLDNVVVFYLTKSERVIHSAIMINSKKVLDILGKRDIEEIKDFYDAQNNLLGIYNNEGHCSSTVISNSDFDQNQFYTNNNYDKISIINEKNEWIENLI
jgi:hypothetical protein